MTEGLCPPAWQRALAESLGNELNRHGFAHCRAQEGWTIEAVEAAIHSRHPHHKKAHPTVLRPHTRASAPSGTMSSYVGLDTQPPHTDCAYIERPPRLVMLHCLERGAEECPTYVWSLRWEELCREAPSALRRVFAFGPRRGRMFYAPVLERIGTDTRLRFDPLCMQADDVGLIEAAYECLKLYAFELAVNWQAGDYLVIDNWRCLHHRGRVSSTVSGRALLRFYWED